MDKNVRIKEDVRDMLLIIKALEKKESMSSLVRDMIEVYKTERKINIKEV